MLSRIFYVFLFVLIINNSASFADDNYDHPWGPDFIEEGIYIMTLVCDSGDTEFVIFYGPETKDASNPQYQGMVLSVDKIGDYIIFIPDAGPNSYRMIYREEVDGSMIAITDNELSAILQNNAPNLYAQFSGEESDCIGGKKIGKTGR